MKKFAKDIIVSGKVQGVFFRASAQNKARELGVCGHAKNLSNGKVHIHAEGSEWALEQFIIWCQQGPEHAEVSDVMVSASLIENPTDFNIIR